MSIRTMSIVWANSKQSGTGLLLLLAIADIGNDSGEAYPGIPKLAQRVRLTERGLQKLIPRVVTDGELFVEPRFILDEAGKRKNKTNLYFIILPGLDNEHALKVYPNIPRPAVHHPGEQASSSGSRPAVHHPGEQASSPESLIDPLNDSLNEQGGAEAARNKLISQIIEVWVTGWAGAVSGKPYANNTYRADAKKIAETTSLEDIKRYTLAIGSVGKWANARPSWGIWFNDMGEYLKRHPAPDEPQKAKDPELTPDELARAERLAERQSKVFGGQI